MGYEMFDVKYIICNDNITLYYRGESVTLLNSHPNFKLVKAELENGNDVTAFEIANNKAFKESVETENMHHSDEVISIKDGVLYYNEHPIRGVLANKIISARRNELKREFKRLKGVLLNLMQNPSYRAVNELYGFLEANNIPLTDDGCFLAFKNVRENFTDIYTGKISNAIGKTVSMPRNLVDEDSTQTCSHGLHVCSSEYLPKFSHSMNGRTLAVKVNPRDVVAIPADYHNSKMRVCEYTVVEEIKTKNTKIVDAVLKELNNNSVEEVLNTLDDKPTIDNLPESNYDQKYDVKETDIIASFSSRKSARHYSKECVTDTKVVDSFVKNVQYSDTAIYRRWMVVKVY